MRTSAWAAALFVTALAGCPATPDAPADASVDSPRVDAGGADAVGCSAPDRDGDGFRSIECGGPDCDDDDPATAPTATEICDAAGHDEDCDPLTVGPRDADGDGFLDAACCNDDPVGGSHCGLDCDDTRRTVSPDSPEVCNDVDDDCDLGTDEGVQVRYYRDDDVDGHGLASDFMELCAPVGAYRATIDDDCDDGDALIHPGAAERCNALDDDCSSGGGVELAEDEDGDLHTVAGFTACETGFPRDDCDDTRALVHPGADFQPEPFCTSMTPCIEAGVWVCAMRTAGARTCSDILLPAPTPSWNYDCDPAIERVPRGTQCFSGCLDFPVCPVPVPGTFVATTDADCGMVFPHFECGGTCNTCATNDLGDRPLGCR